MRSRICALFVVGVLVASCGGPGDVTLARSDVARASADPAGATEAGAAINAFGVELFLEAMANGTDSDANAVVSPASIVLALSMARAGARGDTAAEMDLLLHDVATDEHAAWLNALDAALDSRTGTFKDSAGKDLPVTLRIANAPFSQRGMALVPAFLDALASRFGAGLRLVDYERDTEAARQAINAWVAEQTERRILELLARGVLDDQTRLTLVNAIYLKAAWQTPFAEGATKPASFTLADGSTVDVPTMIGQLEGRYAEGSGWRAVELPYVGGSLAMTIIVPDDLADFQASLTPETMAAVTDGLADRTINLSLPKFGIESKLDLKDVLAAMGMPTAFAPDAADFSGITPQEQLYITAVIHQANIDVDEQGTTAAAATAVVMGRTSAPADVVTLQVDRPFLFALRDVPTGTILFFGRVEDSSSSGGES